MQSRALRRNHPKHVLLPYSELKAKAEAKLKKQQEAAEAKESQAWLNTADKYQILYKMLSSE